MTEIIGVRFKDGGKVYYFNPNGVPVQVGQHVIIETSKGVEFGECALANTMVDEIELIAALRPMLRIATEEDLQRVEANERNEKRAFAICQEKILEHKLEMKLVEVKYSSTAARSSSSLPPTVGWTSATWSRTWQRCSEPGLNCGRLASGTRPRSWVDWASAAGPSAAPSF